jgi:hypothetical protein
MRSGKSESSASWARTCDPHHGPVHDLNRSPLGPGNVLLPILHAHPNLALSYLFNPSCAGPLRDRLVDGEVAKPPERRVDHRGDQLRQWHRQALAERVTEQPRKQDRR